MHPCNSFHETHRKAAIAALRRADEGEHDLAAERVLSYFRRSGENFPAMTEYDANQIAVG
ncbi:hypothetical protein IE4872_CH01896 [Rhizobium gallicum]|uniref:Uncharacterized protein n=1 Tax=Rhizobium gallicum TaxID=56730 RepID=A0A1L5NHZ5_9HYPH|nr:hypothetical protein IE4872_CH01896 [Rhizobium gallicum]